MPKGFTKVKKDNEMPTFTVRFWDVSKEKLLKREMNVSASGLSKRFAKHFFEGKIAHVQSGEEIIFHSLSEFHAFIEKHRL